MNAEIALKLARRFIELPQDKRPLFLDGLREEGVEFSLLPIPDGVVSEDRDELSYAQRRMWFLWQLDPQGAAYNLPMAVRLSGPLDRAAFEAAFASLVQRHETLRTVFPQRADGTRARLRWNVRCRLTSRTYPSCLRPSGKPACAKLPRPNRCGLSTCARGRFCACA